MYEDEEGERSWLNPAYISMALMGRRNGALLWD